MKLFDFYHSMSGFAHPLTFTEINDDDIAKMEKFMREEATELAIDELRKSIDQNSDLACEVLLDYEKKVEIFGNTFASCPRKFRFLPGDINCIKLLVAHVKQVVSTKSGRLQFQEKKKKKMKCDVHTLKNQAEDELTCDESASTEAYNEMFAAELYEKVINCMASYGLDITEWTGNLIEIDSSHKRAKVNCILCDRDGDGVKKPKSIYYHTPETRKGYWVLANLTKHFEKIHLLVANRSNRKKSASEVDSNVLAKRVKMLKDDLTDIEQNLQHSNEPDSPVVKQESNGTNRSLDLSVQIINSTASVNELDNTWLYTLLSQQTQLMLGAIITNGEAQQKMKFILNDRSYELFVVETQDDGNCLYSALAHQLWQKEITSKQHEKLRKKLRSTVVEHILNEDNFPRYAFAMEERLREKKQDFDENADIISECKLYVRHCLSRDRQWGGLESIKAVSCECSGFQREWTMLYDQGSSRSIQPQYINCISTATNRRW